MASELSADYCFAKEQYESYHNFQGKADDLLDEDLKGPKWGKCKGPPWNKKQKCGTTLIIMSCCSDS